MRVIGTLAAYSNLLGTAGIMSARIQELTSVVSNVSLQRTGDCLEEVVVAAALVRHASDLHLLGETVARS